MEKVKNLHINYSFMNNSLVNNSQVNSAQVNSARVNNSRANNKLASKFTSLALAASIIFGTVAIPTETKCDYSFSDIACKTTKTLGYLLITKLGVKIVASSFFIAQNIAQFYKDKNNSKTGLLKHLPFYLGNTGLLLSNLINYKKPAANLYSAWLSAKIILGKKNFKKALDWALTKKIKPSLKYFPGEEFCNAFYKRLKALIDAWLPKEKKSKAMKKIHANAKQKLSEELRDNTKSDLHKFFARQYGVKTIANSLLIGANGCSFYNQENCVTTGAKKALPFYLSNSGSLLNRLAGERSIHAATSLAQIIIGEKKTDLVINYLCKITPEFIQPILGKFLGIPFLMKENKPDKEIGHEKAGIKIKI